jgi:hypothetical protein
MALVKRRLTSVPLPNCPTAQPGAAFTTAPNFPSRTSSVPRLDADQVLVDMECSPETIDQPKFQGLLTTPDGSVKNHVAAFDSVRTTPP